MKLVDKNNKILKTKCDEHIISEHSEKLVYDMIVTMQEKDAIGLAAPQVGENTALMIIGHKDTGFVVCINPMWDKAEDSEDEEFLEGCVSFPGLELKITRPNKIVGTFTDLQGERNHQHLLEYGHKHSNTNATILMASHLTQEVQKTTEEENHVGNK